MELGSGLALPLSMLAFAVVGLAGVLYVSGQRQRLVRRVGESTQRGEMVIPAVNRAGADLISRKVGGQARGRWLNWLLRMPIDLPLAHVVPPVLVLAGTTAFAVAVGWAGGFLLSWWASLADAVFVWFVVTRAFFGWELDRYRLMLLRQIPDAIHLVISATRAGLPVSESFRTVVQEMPNPTSAEFARVVDEMSLGMAPDEALLNMHRRTGVTEYAIFAVTVGVQARSGGRLAETITNLAETVRDRIAVAGKAHALSTEARTSAIIMTILPIATGALLGLTRPGYLHPLFYDPRGQNMLLFGVATLVLGTITMRQMIKAAVRD